MENGDVVQHVHYYKKFGLVLQVSPYMATVEFENDKRPVFLAMSVLAVVKDEREKALFLARRALRVSSS